MAFRKKQDVMLIQKPYRTDYCLISKDIIEKLINVEVGGYEVLGKHSDHVPLSVTFES